MRDQLPVLHQAWEASLLAGDKILSLMNLGVSAAFRLWSAFDLAEVETFTYEAPMEFSNWQENLRGGVFLVAVRQYVRALQGKTEYCSSTSLFDDEDHKQSVYLDFIDRTASNPDRPTTLYMSYYFIALFRFGYINDAVPIGERLVATSPDIFCIRYRYSTLLYMSLCYLALIRANPEDSDQ
jgi:hypothetical protein